MSLQDLKLCRTCTESLKAYYRHRDAKGALVPEDDKLSITICDECVSANTAHKYTIGSRVQLRSWDITKDPEQADRFGIITGIKQPNHTDNVCVSYGVQFPVSGGHLVGEPDLVLVDPAAKYIVVASGQGWIQAITCDSRDAANEFVTSLTQDAKFLGQPTAASVVSVTDSEGAICDSVTL